MIMDKHVQRKSFLIDLVERTGEYFSRMKVITKLFANKVPNISNSKAIAAT